MVHSIRPAAQAAGLLEPYAQARCNVIGTLGNHEFDEGASELLAC